MSADRPNYNDPGKHKHNSIDHSLVSKKEKRLRELYATAYGRYKDSKVLDGESEETFVWRHHDSYSIGKWKASSRPDFARMKVEALRDIYRASKLEPHGGIEPIDESNQQCLIEPVLLALSTYVGCTSQWLVARLSTISLFGWIYVFARTYDTWARDYLIPLLESNIKKFGESDSRKKKKDLPCPDVPVAVVQECDRATTLAISRIGKPTFTNLVLGDLSFGEVDLVYMTDTHIALVEVKGSDSSSDLQRAKRQMRKYRQVFHTLRPDKEIVCFTFVGGELKYVYSGSDPVVEFPVNSRLPPALLKVWGDHIRAQTPKRVDSSSEDKQ